MITIAMVFFAFVATAMLTGAARQFALHRDILDHPNERSSHTVVTPRGGGVAIVFTVLGTLLAVIPLGLMDVSTSTTLIFAGSLLAAVGWWDDLEGLSAVARFVAHLAVATAAVLVIGSVNLLPLSGTVLDLGVYANFVTVLGITYMINATNFMDGIDGIAGAEVAFVGAGAGLFAFLQGDFGTATIAWTLAASCCGFLLWNWPPAKIFMGDVGSGFLGFFMSVLILLAYLSRRADLWALAMLPGAFFVDATYTLLRRMASGHRWYKPHRSHAYQHAALRWGHRNVTATVTAINLLWIFPLAWAAHRRPDFGLPLAALAWAPLVGLVIWQRAGIQAKS
jgi:Fuc2NAc and GlcNAc transferase